MWKPGTNFEIFNRSAASFVYRNLHVPNSSDGTFFSRAIAVNEFAQNYNLQLFTKEAKEFFDDIGEFGSILSAAYLSTLAQEPFSRNDILFIFKHASDLLTNPIHIVYVIGFLETVQKNNFAPASILPYALNSLKVTSNILHKRVVYVDDFLSVTYGGDAGNKKIGELMVAVRLLPTGWTFEHNPDIRIPISSLRKAKNAVKKWRKFSLKGELVNENHSVRISKFLGLRICEKYAYLDVSAGKGFGFK